LSVITFHELVSSILIFREVFRFQSFVGTVSEISFRQVSRGFKRSQKGSRGLESSVCLSAGLYSLSQWSPHSLRRDSNTPTAFDMKADWCVKNAAFAYCLHVVCMSFASTKQSVGSRECDIKTTRGHLGYSWP